ncbi:AAC(3)-I family aminoglycoside N-acetyltransferase [uncultured Paracoccus sp.]|uniref:AAC(3)-I family aminoglycoside N-acetyltransferase n=1 Tax=uncultured Paracoccus sp. TaxID=189685 RepID=UPI00261D097E|nr:AAC(3)-I family aminoglycoside N-acetyltransferase [uncultured Paracoccus sp.]
MSYAPITIRQLGPEDLPRARALNRLFAQVFDDPGSYQANPPDDAYLSELLTRGQAIVLIAEEGGTVTGGLVAYDLPKLEQRRSEIYIYDLAVSADHRRQGIATALIEHLRQIARTRGAWVIYVQADHGDDPAIALYTGLGEREDVLHFDIAPD